jgi:hypothetical protein
MVNSYLGLIGGLRWRESIVDDGAVSLPRFLNDLLVEGWLDVHKESRVWQPLGRDRAGRQQPYLKVPKVAVERGALEDLAQLWGLKDFPQAQLPLDDTRQTALGDWHTKVLVSFFPELGEHAKVCRVDLISRGKHLGNIIE